MSQNLTVLWWSLHIFCHSFFSWTSMRWGLQKNFLINGFRLRSCKKCFCFLGWLHLHTAPSHYGMKWGPHCDEKTSFDIVEVLMLKIGGINGAVSKLKDTLQSLAWNASHLPSHVSRPHTYPRHRAWDDWHFRLPSYRIPVVVCFIKILVMKNGTKERHDSVIFSKETIDSRKRRRNDMSAVLCKYPALMICNLKTMLSLLFLFTESKSTVTLLLDENIKLKPGAEISRRIEKNVHSEEIWHGALFI